MNRSQTTAWVKAEALKLGFSHCGISKAGFLEEEAPRLEQWLTANMHGTMSYMERNFDKRLDPTKLVEGARSVISLLFNYYPEKKQNPQAPQISKYAYGTDYHFVIKEKLFQLLELMRQHIGAIDGRVFVDSAPVLDRAWARKSGLGWIGKNNNLINPQSGSWYFIAELILDIELDADAPIKDYCGTCTKCIDACPTEAIVMPHVVDGSKCISYLTIELKSQIPASFKEHMEGWIYGCDICQEVCPWNRFSTPHSEPAFEMSSQLHEMKRADWLEMTEEVFDGLFSKSAVKRAGYAGLNRNIQFLSSGDH